MMNATQIAEALRNNPNAEETHRLVLACEHRRQAIRARIASIAMPASAAFAVPPERAAAHRRGLDAVARLDAEIEELNREFAYCDTLERLANDHAETSRQAAVRAAAPKSRKQLATVCARVRKALAELDAALEAVGTTIAPIASFSELPGEKFMLTDDEAASLIELREEVWKVRNLPALRPHGSPDDLRVNYPRCFELMFEFRGSGGAARLIERGPPRRIDLHEVGEPTYVRFG